METEVEAVTPTLADHIATLAKKAAESTMAGEAHNFAAAAFQLAEAHGIVEHVKDAQADRADRKTADEATPVETAPKGAKAVPKPIAA